MYGAAIEDTYLEILKFEARVICFFAGRSFKRGFQEMIKWNDWESWFEEITSKETALKEIEERYNQVNVERRWRHSWDEAKKRHDEMMDKLDVATTAITKISTDRDNMRKDQERNKFIEWLNPMNRYVSDQGNGERRVTARPQPNAYSSGFSKWLTQWLTSWQDTQNSFLWLCGKGMFASPTHCVKAHSLASWLWEVEIEVRNNVSFISFMMIALSLTHPVAQMLFNTWNVHSAMMHLPALLSSSSASESEQRST